MTVAPKTRRSYQSLKSMKIRALGTGTGEYKRKKERLHKILSTLIKSSTRSWASLQFGCRYRQDKKAHRSECIDRIDGRGLPLRLLLLHRGPSTMRNAVLTLLSSGLRPPLLLKDQIVARPLNRIAKFAETAPNLHARRHVRVSAKFAQPAPPCSGLQIAFPVPTASDRPSASSSHSSSSRCCCQHCLNCPLLSSPPAPLSSLLSSPLSLPPDSAALAAAAAQPLLSTPSTSTVRQTLSILSSRFRLSSHWDR